MAVQPPPRALAPALHPHQHQLGQPRRAAWAADGSTGRSM